MNIAIIIVSYASASDIAKCLEALELSTHEQFSVVIVENAGGGAFQDLDSPRIPRVLSRGQSVERYLAPANLGFAGGVNHGLERAGAADAYWILNPDTTPEPNALSAMVERLMEGDCDAVGSDLGRSDGRLASRGGRWQAWAARSLAIDHGAARDATVERADVEAQMDYIVGASMLVSSRFVRDVGPMREDYFLYCEEVEWCLRARKLGKKLGYAPNAVVDHARGVSTGGGGPIGSRSRLAVSLDERNRLLLTRDAYPLLLPLAAGASLLKLLIVHARARALRQLGFALEGWMAGLRNERGPPPWLLDTTSRNEAPARAKKLARST